MIDHLCANGILNPELLFKAPFTDFHDQGVAGVWGDEAPRLIEAIHQINSGTNEL